MTPPKVEVDPQSQGTEGDGRVSSRAHACINEEYFLSHFKKNKNWFLDLRKSLHQLGAHLWGLSLGIHVPSLGSGVLLSPGKSLLPFLSPIMIIIELTSPLIPGVGRWLSRALLSSSHGDNTQPVTTLGAVGEAGWQGTEGELKQEGRSQRTKCWIQPCLNLAWRQKLPLYLVVT